MLHDGKFRVKLGLPDGDAFPTNPAPERGDIFYRADEDKIYRFNGVWVEITQGADHGVLSGLGDDDHTQYFLADCTRAFAGDPIPDGADTRSLGSPDAEWENLYIGEAGRIYFRLNQSVDLYSSAAGVLKTNDNFHPARVFVGDGLVGSPAYAFQNDVDIGMYRIGVNDLGFTTNSILALELNAVQQALVTAGTVAAPGLAFISDPDTGLYRLGANRLGFATNGTFAVEISATQQVFINETTNTFMSLGLTINQGAYDNEILSLKSSDVAHGITDFAETNTYGRFAKVEGAAGGLDILAFKDADGVASQALDLRAILGEAAETLKSFQARGVIFIQAQVKDGTGATAVGADGNLVVIANAGNARFIFDAEGSAHAEVEWTTFQDQDDLALIADMEQELLLPGGEGQASRRRILEEVGMIGKDSWHMENGKPRAMVNFTKLSMLHHGALIQVAAKLAVYEQALIALGVQPEMLIPN